jgi:hypothetical protein
VELRYDCEMRMAQAAGEDEMFQVQPVPAVGFAADSALQRVPNMTWGGTNGAPVDRPFRAFMMPQLVQMHSAFYLFFTCPFVDVHPAVTRALFRRDNTTIDNSSIYFLVGNTSSGPFVTPSGDPNLPGIVRKPSKDKLTTFRMVALEDQRIAVLGPPVHVGAHDARDLALVHRYYMSWYSPNEVLFLNLDSQPSTPWPPLPQPPPPSPLPPQDARNESEARHSMRDDYDHDDTSARGAVRVAQQMPRAHDEDEYAEEWGRAQRSEL